MSMMRTTIIQDLENVTIDTSAANFAIINFQHTVFQQNKWKYSIYLIFPFILFILSIMYFIQLYQPYVRSRRSIISFQCKFSLMNIKLDVSFLFISFS
jgi:hypothetical protein